MKYPDSIERSAELLRLAIPHMSRQTAALHPVSYAVWYEYVSGRNQALCEHIDHLLAQDEKLDEQGTLALYASHVADFDPALARQVTDGMRTLLQDMAESAEQTGQQTRRFGSSLATFNEQLQQEGRNGGAVETVMATTRDMQHAMDHLHKRLQESQTEIDKLRREVERARSDARVDSLTGLGNRRAFDDCLTQFLENDRGPESDVCMVMLDIDHFKRVNDAYGHLFGDRVIRAVAQILRASIKGQDIAARVGGEEFAIVLPATPLSGAAVVAEHIRTAVAASRIRRGQEQLQESITVSLGVAKHRPGEAASDFVARADAALYASKSGGRNRWTLAATT